MFAGAISFQVFTNADMVTVIRSGYGEGGRKRKKSISFCALKFTMEKKMHLCLVARNIFALSNHFIGVPVVFRLASFSRVEETSWN